MSSEQIEVQYRTLWIGEIPEWMDEAYIERRLLFYKVPVKNVKIIRNRIKGISLGYGFIEFFSRLQAEQVLSSFHDKAILDLQTNSTFKLNWASDSASKAACLGGLPKNEFTIYVGDLDLNTTEEELKEFFCKYYKSVLGTKIVIDPITKKSKGYGFVKFNDSKESNQALTEMNGKVIRGKAVKVNQASFKKLSEMQNITQSLIPSSTYSTLVPNNSSIPIIQMKNDKMYNSNDPLTSFFIKREESDNTQKENRYNLFDFYNSQSQFFNYINPFDLYKKK